MTAPVPTRARADTLRVLRVGDGIVGRTRQGEWRSPTYYQVDQILGGFRSAGADVRLTAFSRIVEEASFGYPMPVNRIDVTGVEVSSKGIRALGSRLPTVRRLLSEAIDQADVVWAMLPSMLGLFALELSPPRKVCVAQLVGDPAISLRSCRSGLTGAALARIGELLVHRAIRRAQGAIFVSPTLARRYGGRSLQSIVANESRLMCAQLRTAAQVRATCGPGNRILFVGRISPEKGLAYLLDAMANLPSARLTIVGKGPQRPQLEQRCGEMGLNDRVLFLGELVWGEPVLEIMQGHDIFVLPSLTEGMPLVVLEAMSQGLPVIATRVGGIPDLVRDGVNGILVQAKDAADLARGIAALMRDADARMRLALAGLETARENTADVQYGRAAAYISRLASRGIA